MNKHSNEAPQQRFYGEDDTVHADPGCYVDGCMSLRACTWRAVTVAYGFGAVTPEKYSEWTGALHSYAEEDGSDTYVEIGHQVEEALNEQNTSETHSWYWEHGNLIYGVNG